MLLLCLFMFLAPGALIVFAFSAQLPFWQEFITGSLFHYLVNTLFLVFGGGMICLLWGLSTAWLTAHYRFPLHQSLRWLLLLPFACPTYLSGFIYADLLDGYVASARTIYSGMLLFGLGLYPYVYVFSRAAFNEQSVDYRLAARSMGLNPVQVFWRITVPMALPFVSFGCLLAVIEIINDFGLVNHYAINTLSLGIYRTWLGLGNFGAAVQLSLCLLVLLGIILYGENYLLRKRKRFENISRRRHLPIHQLATPMGWIACFWCCMPILFGFVIPVAYLGYGALNQTTPFVKSLWLPLANTFTLVGTVIFCCLLVGLMINYATRPLGPKWQTLGQSINLCYALPGTLMGLAVISLFTRLHHLSDVVLLGGFVGLVYAYLVRFTPPANRMLHNSLEQITPSIEKAARGFGVTGLTLFRRIHLPLIQTSLLSAVIIIFAEAVRELPLALMLRPFNFETLATYTYQYVSDEQLRAAAPPALLLICAGVPALYILNRLISRVRGDEILYQRAKN